jgi:hypothetical protein
MFSGLTGKTLEILFLPRPHVRGSSSDLWVSDLWVSLFRREGDCNELPSVFLPSCTITFSAGLASSLKSSAVLFFCLETSSHILPIALLPHTRL